MIRKLLQKIPYPFGRAAHRRTTPAIIPASQHTLRRERLSRNAVNVVERLQQAGFEAFAVGGCVRDLLLDLTPKDFDVATSATPEEVRATFRNARLIGRRFKLVHVHFGREIIEVATFVPAMVTIATKARSANSPVRVNPAGCFAITSMGHWKKTRSVATSPSTRCTTTSAAARSTTSPTVCMTFATARYA